MNILKVKINVFSSKGHVFLIHFWRKIQKISGTYYIKKRFLKSFTKGNQLEPIWNIVHTKPLFSAVTENNAKVVASHGCYAMHQFEWNLPTVHLFLAFQTKFLLMKLPDLVVRRFGSSWSHKNFKFLFFFLEYFLNNLIMFHTIF